MVWELEFRGEGSGYFFKPVDSYVCWRHQLWWQSRKENCAAIRVFRGLGIRVQGLGFLARGFGALLKMAIQA